MKLQEVFESKRRFKRAKDMYWHKPMIGTDTYLFSKEEIAANDWELDEKKLNLGQSEILNAIDSVRMRLIVGKQDFIDGVLQELGFYD